MAIEFTKRPLRKDELEKVNIGFDQVYAENGIIVEHAENWSIVAMDDEKFVGCATGLAYKNGEVYNGWLLLTDLFVSKPYRSKGIGQQLLNHLENDVLIKGVKHIWLWTSDEKTIRFYKRFGYEIFTEMPHWYSDGSSRIGLKKKLEMHL